MGRSNNVGWEGDEATEVIKSAFKEGIIKSGDGVLDIGCGFGRNANWLAKMGAEVTAVNINDDEIRQAKLKAQEAQVSVNYIHADATSLPFPNNSFEIALDLGCSHMIPSKKDQRKAMRQTARILKPGGYLIYFGFSKNHPSYLKNKRKSQFRSIEDIQDVYGEKFEILSHEETRWKPKSTEHANFKEHVGINVIMKRKLNI